MEKIRATLRISRNSADRYCLTIQDETSRVQIIELDMDAREFGQAVTGMSTDDIRAEIGDLSLVGRKGVTETREVWAPLESNKALSEAHNAARLEAMVVQLESERPGYGWWARTGDLGNMHRRVKGKPDTYRVTFFGHEPRGEG